jgi:hypothetical protein
MSDQEKTILPPALQSLAEKVGLRGGWVLLRQHWDPEAGKYDRTEQSYDGETWGPYTDDANAVSVRFVGGPRDGQVEW